MKAQLVVVGGDAKAAEVSLRLPTVIGRGRDVSLTLPHPLVSRRHCEIFESGGQLFVRDLGSLNGTFVGNDRVTEAPLPPGELLTVGTVTFRAVYEANGTARPTANPAAVVSPTRAADTVFVPKEQTVRNDNEMPDFQSLERSAKSGSAKPRPADDDEEEFEEVELAIDDDDGESDQASEEFDPSLAEFASPLLDDETLSPSGVSTVDSDETKPAPNSDEEEEDDDDLQSFLQALE
ncbi:MAG: FHA domain-containing protein [Planctomycetales bacterium]|nr:FHA domain-containing protein [Planctomycetales bacterium]